MIDFLHTKYYPEVQSMKVIKKVVLLKSGLESGA